MGKDRKEMLAILLALVAALGLGGGLQFTAATPPHTSIHRAVSSAEEDAVSQKQRRVAAQQWEEVAQLPFSAKSASTVHFSEPVFEEPPLEDPVGREAEVPAPGVEEPAAEDAAEVEPLFEEEDESTFEQSLAEDKGENLREAE